MSRIPPRLARVASAVPRAQPAPSTGKPRRPAVSSASGGAFVLALAAIFLGAPAEAQGQPIYRCGNEYTSAPCLEGRALANADTRSAQERNEARAIVEQQKRVAAAMERDRRRDEASIRPALAGSLGPSRPGIDAPAPRDVKKKHHKKNPGQGDNVGAPFTAAAPVAVKHRR